MRKLENKAVLNIIAQAQKAGAKELTYAKLETLACATSNILAQAFLKNASLQDRVVVKNHLYAVNTNIAKQAVVNGEKPKKISDDKGTLFGLTGEKETNISSDAQDKIYDPTIKKVETTEDQKNMRTRSKNEDKHPETSDHKVKKDVVETPGVPNKEYEKFIAKRNSFLKKVANMTNPIYWKSNIDASQTDVDNFLNQVTESMNNLGDTPLYLWEQPPNKDLPDSKGVQVQTGEDIINNIPRLQDIDLQDINVTVATYDNNFITFAYNITGFGNTFTDILYVYSIETFNEVNGNVFNSDGTYASKMGRLKVAIDEAPEKNRDLKDDERPVVRKFNCTVDSCEYYNSKTISNCSKDKVNIVFDKTLAKCDSYKNIDADLDITDEDLETYSSRIQKGESPKNVISGLINFITGKRKIARMHKKFADMVPGEAIQVMDNTTGQPVNMTVDSVSTMTGTGEPALVAKTETGETTVIPTGTEVTTVAPEVV